jgi:hypothetical protein
VIEPQVETVAPPVVEAPDTTTTQTTPDAEAKTEAKAETKAPRKKADS